MGRLARITVALVGTLAVLLGVAGPASAAPRPYREVDLGSLGGAYAPSYAVAVNDYGVAVGVSQTPDGPHGTLWQPDGTKIDLGGGPLPVDINDLGDIAFAGSRGYVRHADGSATRYFDGLVPYRMNNVGQLILRRPDTTSRTGYRYYFAEANTEYLAFEFPSNWVMSDLNDQGQVVGTKYGTTSFYGVVWQRGVGVIKNLGPATAAKLINNHGHVVMFERVFCGDPCRGGYDTTYYLVANGARTYVAYSRDYSPLAMNEKDQIVGSYGSIDAYYTAWVWSKGVTTALSRCSGGCEYPAANDINERGEIVGQANLPILPDPPEFLDVNRAILWTKAPR